jgi:lambda family phage portal protein
MPRKPATKAPVPKPKAGKAPKAQGYNGGVGAGYEAARFTGRRSFLWLSPAQDQRRDLTPAKRSELVKKMRWGERNSGQIREMVGDLVLYTVGDGFRPQAHTSDPEWNKTAEAYFANWARRCDITNRFSFNDLLRIAERRWVLDGDFFLAKVRNAAGAPKLQGIEAHRVGSPETVDQNGVHDGVVFGSFGEVKAYWVIRADGTYRQMPANSMMMVHDPEFVSGARGLPLLQHSWNDLQDLMELLALEKSAVRDHAEITRVLKRGGGEFGPDLASELASNPQSADALGVGLGGKFIALQPGEDLVHQASARPNSNFDSFIKAVKQDASAGVMPAGFTDPTMLNGPGVRLVIAKMDRIASRHQTVLIENVCSPTWGYVIGDAIARGELPDVEGWEKHSWTTPKRITVDAGREAANDRADVEMGLLSMSEIYSQRGMDFREEMEKRAADMAYIRDLATRAGLPFELLYRMSNAQPGSMSAAGATAPTPQP